MQNIQSAVELHIQDRLALAQEIPQAQMSSFSMIHYIPSRWVQKIQG
jgi:predicted RNase H-like HicB family nuclease